MRLLLALVLAFPVATAIAGASAPVWAQLTVDQQAALRPLQQRWDRLPEYQRTRLLGAAKHYPALSPSQQRRFSQRLTTWASMSLEQRNQARSVYREYQHMPEAERARVGELWRKQHPDSQLATAGAVASAPQKAGDEPEGN